MNTTISEIIRVAETTIERYRSENNYLRQQIMFLSSLPQAAAPQIINHQNIEDELNEDIEEAAEGETVPKSELIDVKHHYIDELRRISQALRLKEDEVTGLVQKVKDSEREIENLKGQLASNIEKLNELRDAETQLKADVASLTEALEKANASEPSISNSPLFAEIKKQLARETERANTLETKVKTSEEAYRHLDIEKTILERRNEALQKKYDDLKQKADKKASVPSSEVIKANEQLQAKEAELKRLKKEFSKLGEKYSTLKKDYEELLEKHNALVSETENMNAGSEDSALSAEDVAASITKQELEILKNGIQEELAISEKTLLALNIKSDAIMNSKENLVYKQKGRKKCKPTLNKTAKRELSEVQREVSETKTYIENLKNALASIENEAGEILLTEFAYNVYCAMKEDGAFDSQEKTKGISASEVTSNDKVSENNKAEEIEEVKDLASANDKSVSLEVEQDTDKADTFTGFTQDQERQIAEITLDFLSTPETILEGKYGKNEIPLTPFGRKALSVVMTIVLDNMAKAQSNAEDDVRETGEQLLTYFRAAKAMLDVGEGIEEFNILYYIGRCMEERNIVSFPMFESEGTVNSKIDSKTAEVLKKNVPGVALYANPVEQGLTYYRNKIEQ